MKLWMTKKYWLKGILGITIGCMVFYGAGMTIHAASGKITADSAKVRAQASTTAEVTGSVKQGATIDILEEVTDSAGMVWYKVADGYIRSDLVTKDGESSAGSSNSSTTTTTTTTTTTQTDTPADTVPTAITEQAATISVESVRIRSGASTEHGTVASLPKGTEVKLIGQATDSAGKTWYQMTCSYNGKSVEGYVRSDLVTMGAAVQSTDTNTTEPGTDSTAVDEDGNPIEGEVQLDEDGNPIEAETEESEEAATEEPVEENNDYEVVYTQNEAGEYEYYLYDNVQGTRQKLSELLGVVDSANQNAELLQSQLSRERIIIIVLAVVLVILLLVVTLLIFKIRELSFDDDYDEEEEEELDLEEERKTRKRALRSKNLEEEPVRVSRSSGQKGAGGHDEKGSRSRSDRGDAELQAAEYKQDRNRTERSGATKSSSSKNATGRSGSVKSSSSGDQSTKNNTSGTSRKPQNFLLDDDEFEFEFLNMDDKEDR